MATWEPLPVETDEDAVTERILEAIADRLPGWVPVEGAPEVVLAEEIGRETAATNARAGDAGALAHAAFGETVYGLAALPGARAAMLVELATEVGGTIPAGFTVVGVTADGVEAAFELEEQVVADAALVQVEMRARDLGAGSNGVPAGPLTVVTSTASVAAATAVEASSGGTEPESLASYLSRLVSYVAILRPGGVRAVDLAILARNVAGVHRALAIDLYDPTTGATNAERTVTVVPVDAAGQPVPAAVADEVRAELEDVREVNFVIHVAEPTYTPVHVEFTAVAEVGADPATVAAAVVDAIAAYLDPALWGTTAEDPGNWRTEDTVRYLEVARIGGSVEGVAYLSALTIDGGTVDVTLPGAAPLPAPLTAVDPTTVTGTAV